MISRLLFIGIGLVFYAFSGIETQSSKCVPTFVPLKNKHMDGAENLVANEKACKDACLKLPICIAVGYNAGTKKCYIVAELGNMTAANGETLFLLNRTSCPNNTTSKPTKPTLPTKPTKPTKPTLPTKPTKPTVPTKPTKLTKPTLPTKPTKPTVPTKPTKPTKPTLPTKITSKATKATLPTKPTKPTKPTVPTKPTKPAKPTKIVASTTTKKSLIARLNIRLRRENTLPAKIPMARRNILSANESNDCQPVFKKTFHHKVDGGKVAIGVFTEQNCASACVQDSKCVSIDYDPAKNVCYINTELLPVKMVLNINHYSLVRPNCTTKSVTQAAIPSNVTQAAILNNVTQTAIPSNVTQAAILSKVTQAVNSTKKVDIVNEGFLIIME